MGGRPDDGVLVAATGVGASPFDGGARLVPGPDHRLTPLVGRSILGTTYLGASVLVTVRCLPVTPSGAGQPLGNDPTSVCTSDHPNPTDSPMMRRVCGSTRTKNG